MRLPHSIRWRLMLWFGFLLGMLLAGFGVTGYQLQRMRLLAKVDDELANRLATLGGELRQSAPPRPRPRPPLDGDDPMRPRRPGPPRNESQEPPTPDGPRGPQDGPRGPQDGPRGPQDGRGQDGRPGGPPPDGFRPGPPEPLPPLEPVLSSAVRQRLGEGGYYFAVWGQDGALREQSGLPADFKLPPRGDDERGMRVATRTRAGFREAYHFAERGAGMLVGCSIQPMLDDLQVQQGRLATAGIGVLALGLAGCWWITVRSLRPVSEIGSAARRIANGNMAERITIRQPHNELGELAAVLNETFARLDEAFSRQVRFTADASHELRTPLAMMISEAQATLARERPAAEYREALEHCHAAAQQMRALVNALLELARLDASAPCRPATPMDIDPFLAGLLDELEPLATQAGCRVERQLEPLRAPADEAYLRLIVTNLFANAAHYNRPGGSIRVSCSQSATTGIIRVEDTGVGIASEHLAKIFERFFRTDPARSRASGCFGLGLPICQAAAAAIGATISVTSIPNSGSTFTVELPIEPSLPAKMIPLEC